MDRKQLFVLLPEWEDTFKLLSAEQVTALVLAMFALQGRGESPVFTDPMLRIAWVQIEGAYKRLLEAREEKSAKARASIAKRWGKVDTNVYERMRTNETNTNEYDGIPTNTNVEIVSSRINENTNDTIQTNPIQSKPNQDNDSLRSLPEATAEAEASSKRKAEKITFGYGTDNRIHGITDEQIALWQEQCPALDVRDSIRKAEIWLGANPKNRKSDIKRFLGNWLLRQQERAPRTSCRPEDTRKNLGGRTEAEERENMKGLDYDTYGDFISR